MAVQLRQYVPADEDAAVALWLRTWQVAYPSLDFTARVAWWRQRWCSELVSKSHIAIAENDHALIGFVTIDAHGYIDQLVVAPEHWRSGVGAALIEAAKHISPQGLDLHVNQDNHRAIAFYRKHGFVTVGEDVNPRSGAPIFRMSWQP